MGLHALRRACATANAVFMRVQLPGIGILLPLLVAVAFVAAVALPGWWIDGGHLTAAGAAASMQSAWWIDLVTPDGTGGRLSGRPLVRALSLP
jgi:hypothetical protein